MTFDGFLKWVSKNRVFEVRPSGCIRDSSGRCPLEVYFNDADYTGAADRAGWRDKTTESIMEAADGFRSFTPWKAKQRRRFLAAAGLTVGGTDIA